MIVSVTRFGKWDAHDVNIKKEERKSRVEQQQYFITNNDKMGTKFA